MSGALVPRTEKQQRAQTKQILPKKLGSTYSPTKNKGGLLQSRRRGPGIHTSAARFLLATKELRGRLVFEMPEWSSRVVQIDAVSHIFQPDDLNIIIF